MVCWIYRYVNDRGVLDRRDAGNNGNDFLFKKNKREDKERKKKTTEEAVAFLDQHNYLHS